MRNESNADCGLRIAKSRSINPKSEIKNLNSKGMSLIAAIFILVILAFMGVMFVSLISTGSFTAINDMQSSQALYIAEGGVEYAQYALAQNLDWYRSASDPMPAPSSTTLPLGAGSFIMTTSLPATMLSKRLPAGGGTATVYTTQRFPTACPAMPGGVCYLQIDDDAGGGTGEFVSYTGTTINTFTGLGRNQTIGAVPSAGGNSSHARGSRVYPVTVLAAGTSLVNTSCTTIPNPFQIIANTPSKFLGAGTINVYDSTAPANSEEILYTGSSTAGNITTLTGVQRCQNGGAPITAAAGSPVTTLTVGVSFPNYEAEVSSTGSAGSAVRSVKKTIQR